MPTETSQFQETISRDAPASRNIRSLRGRPPAPADSRQRGRGRPTAPRWLLSPDSSRSRVCLTHPPLTGNAAITWPKKENSLADHPEAARRHETVSRPEFQAPCLVLKEYLPNRTPISWDPLPLQCGHLVKRRHLILQPVHFILNLPEREFGQLHVSRNKRVPTFP